VIPRALRQQIDNRIYGCDDCLAVCPWNKYAQLGRDAKLSARPDLRAPTLADLAGLDDPAFRAKFAKTAIKRTGRDRFVRNVLIAIGNSGERGLALHAERLLIDPAAVVRGAAVWALSRLLPADDFRALAARHRAQEADADVAEEWTSALAECT
jgi:epoxyqueuosine reductase